LKLTSNQFIHSGKIFIFLVFTTFSSIAQLSEKYVLIEKEYSKSNYQEVINIYSSNNGKVTSKEYVNINLMVADACCKTKKYESGKNIYSHLINDCSEYLSNDDIKKLNNFSLNCNADFTAESSASSKLNDVNLLASVLRLEATSNVILTSSGKEYSFTLHGAEKFTKIPKNQEVTIPKSLEKFDVSDNSGSLAYYQSIHNNTSVKFAISENFIISTYLEMPQTRLDNLAKELDVFYDELIKKYDLLKIPYKIAINIAENRDRMQKLAQRDYGLADVGYSIGFSRMDSYSMLCMIPKDAYLHRGTIRHELMHLLLNYNFSYLPPWFSEGLPALYEAVNSNNEGVDNWRLQIITTLKSEGYFSNDNKFSFENFLNANWDTFNGISDKDWEGNEQDFYLINHLTQSINYAMARYFFLYLQNTNQLNEVFQQITKAPHFAETNLLNYRNEQTNYILQTIKWDRFKSWLDHEYPLSTEMRVQQILKDSGVYTGEIDGSIGPASKQAIAAYQKKKGLKITGIVDDQTLIEMGINKEF
jgi:hypothetical protein